MPVAEVLGQQEAIRLLDVELTSGLLSHAYMIWGPSGSGKMALARGLALAANCNTRQEQGPDDKGKLWYCGVCSNCVKLVGGVHPDFALLAPEGKSIGINQIREMQARIALRPGEGNLKTWVIRRAHTMTEEAQNCLLKVLEEPPGHALIMLLLDDPCMVLPTISSRCHSVRLGTVDRELLFQWGQSESGLGLEPERAHVLAALSEGLPGKMARLATDRTYFEVRERIIALTRSVMWCGDGGKALTASEDLLDALKKAYADAESEEDDAFLETRTIAVPEGACDVMASYMRDLFITALEGGSDALINVDYASLISADAARAPAGQFSVWAEKCVDSGQAMASNANTRLAMDDLMLSLALP